MFPHIIRTIINFGGQRNYVFSKITQLNQIYYGKMQVDQGQVRSAIADARNADNRKYKRMLYSERQAETRRYTNDLHDALINKTGVNFWKCWNSKFEKGTKSSKFIDGLTDDAQIAEAFADQ